MFDQMWPCRKQSSLYPKSLSNRKRNHQIPAAASMHIQTTHYSKKKKSSHCKRYFVICNRHTAHLYYKGIFFIELLQEIILGCNKTSHRLFLIPTIFFFYRFCGVLIAIIEVCLHVWAHKKNAQNKNVHIYYRSPLHVMTSQFCAVCRNRSEMDRVSKLQVKRQQNWQHHLNHVTKTVY